MPPRGRSGSGPRPTRRPASQAAELAIRRGWHRRSPHGRHSDAEADRLLRKWLRRLPLRYRGVAANDQWLHTRLAALNLRRLLNLGLHRRNRTWALAWPSP
jgi:hypothetical protein